MRIGRQACWAETPRGEKEKGARDGRRVVVEASAIGGGAPHRRPAEPRREAGHQAPSEVKRREAGHFSPSEVGHRAGDRGSAPQARGTARVVKRPGDGEGGEARRGKVERGRPGAGPIKSTGALGIESVGQRGVVREAWVRGWVRRRSGEKNDFWQKYFLTSYLKI